MSQVRVRVATGSRLHFGMLGFHQEEWRSYGGLGLMIDRPGCEVVVSRAGAWKGIGPLGERAIEIARTWYRTQYGDEGDAFQVEVRVTAPEHVGLGAGTQLALSVVSGMSKLLDPEWDWRSAWYLGQQAGRGRRSTIGIHGFMQGGLLVEAGRYVAGSAGPLVARLDFPLDWQFVLVRPKQLKGLSGAAEMDAFEALPPVPAELSGELAREVLLRILPAVVDADFSEFSTALARYSRLAGECFAPQQNGTFTGPEVAALVRWLEQLGVTGVGQTSWGPTVFALVPHASAAEDLIGRIEDERPGEFAVYRAMARNRGAEIECEE